jgi:hypothetical protein
LIIYLEIAAILKHNILNCFKNSDKYKVRKALLDQREEEREQLENTTNDMIERISQNMDR